MDFYLSLSIYFKALDDYQYRRMEIINALAIQDCCYSYLEERFAQSKGLSTEKYDIQSILDDVITDSVSFDDHLLIRLRNIVHRVVI